MATSPPGKKDEPPKSAGAKPGSAPADEDELSLDFSHYVPPPPEPKPAAAAQTRGATPPAPPKVEKPAPQVAPAASATVPRPPPPGPTAAPQTTPAARSAKAAVPAAARPSTPGPAGPSPAKAPLRSPGPAVAPVAAAPRPAPVAAPAAKPVPAVPPRAPVIEEGAMLFANGQSMQALTALTRAVRNDELGNSAQQAWLMLFDLYQHLGMKVEFEELGMEFLVKFERSPPDWTETESHFNAALATGGFGYCALTGMLSEDSSSELEQLRRVGERQHALRIDFSKLEGIDPLGAAHLLDALHVLKAAGKAVIITGDSQLLDVLERTCQVGNMETDGVLWSLQFEVLQHLGLKERFEEAAVEYAVTYEVSPPSWEDRKDEKPKPAPLAAADEAGPAALRLSGEITGAKEILVKRLNEWAASNSPLVIDVSGVRRVDFASANQLLEVLTRLRQGGAIIQIRGASELIATLFEVMGIGNVARVVRKR